MALEIVLVGVLRKYETEKFSGSSLNRFIKAKNLVFLIPKTSCRSFLSIFFCRYRVISKSSLLIC